LRSELCVGTFGFGRYSISLDTGLLVMYFGLMLCGQWPAAAN
jgi:hypothetical protein